LTPTSGNPNALAVFFATVLVASALGAGAPGLMVSHAPPAPIVLSHTNSTGAPYHAIPSDNPDDGKFLAIAGEGLQTLADLEMHFFVAVSAGSSGFELSVFDADTGGSWDTGGLSPEPLFLRLYRDPLKSGTSTASLVTSWTGSGTPDDGWDVHNFATDAGARAPSGNYFYRLDIGWLNPAGSSDNFNNFKLRSTGQLSAVPGQNIGFSGGPQNGDPPVGSGDPNPDPESNDANANSYNGAWDWCFYQPAALTSLTFTDGDADYFDDTDDFNTPNNDPPGDPEPEGENHGLPADGGPRDPAYKVDPAIFYQIASPDGAVYNNMDPSGNREFEDYIIGPTNADAVVNTTLPAGLWLVRVRGMDAHNFNAIRATAEICSDTDIPLTVNPAPEVEPDHVSQASAGDIVRYAHTVHNRGVGNDTFALTASSSRGWSTRIYHDANANGLLDSGEGLTGSTGILGTNGTYYLIVEVVVPAGLTADTIDVTTITASSTEEWALQDSAKDTTEVHVNTAPNIQSFTATQAPEGTAVTFEAHASDAQGDALTYSFDFDDDGTFDVSGPSNLATFTWGDDYVGTARVRVSDGSLFSDKTAIVEVLNVAPVAAITVGLADEGQGLTLSYRLTDPGSDDLTIVLDWGDGTVETRSYLLGPSPDGFPSPDVSPRDVSDSLTHVYGDDASLGGLLSVFDDDSGLTQYNVVFVISNVAPMALALAVSCTPVLAPGVGLDSHACFEGEDLYFTATATDPGSDDLTFFWDFGDGLSESRTYYNDGVGPDPDPSTGGTFPFQVQDAGTHIWGDNGVYTVTLTVTDDDGGILTLVTVARIANVAPMLTVVLDALAYDEADTATALASFDDPGSDDVTLSFEWELGPTSSPFVFLNDGVNPDPPLSPRGTYPFVGSQTMAHAYDDNGEYLLRVTATDDDGGVSTIVQPVTVRNVAPRVTFADACDPCVEGSTYPFPVDFSDVGSDDVLLDFDLEFLPSQEQLYFNDAIGPDPVKSPDGVAPFIGTATATAGWGDNGRFAYTVTATDDDGGVSVITGVIEVLNVDPVIEDVQIYAAAEVTLRVAGEKWHDVCLEVVDSGAVTSGACVVRYPGSPDEQSATITGTRIQLLGDTSIVIYYTPPDDPINGQLNGDNPVWVILTFADGSEVRLKHNFNVQHPGTWVWTLDDLSVLLVGKPLTFEVSGSDVGSDDLTFAFDFGDGTTASLTAFWDGVAPDPARSPDFGGMHYVAKTTHTYASAGGYSTTITVTDDDGGSTAETRSFTIG